MLHGRDARTATADQRGPERGLPDVLGSRLDVHGLRQVHPPEQNAPIGRCRAQGHHDFLAGMQPDAGGSDGIAQSSLAQHYDFSIPNKETILGGTLPYHSAPPLASCTCTAIARPARPAAPLRVCPLPLQSAWRRRNAGMSSSSSVLTSARNPSPTARWRTTVGLSITE